MLLHKETADIQSKLSDYCRTGILPELPGITPNRIQQYRRLVYGVIYDTLEGAFPITKDFLPEEEWELLVNTFFSKHTCSNYSVWKMPFEFYEFYTQTESPLKVKYPFLTDLLYFEWIEIEVHTMPDMAIETYKTEGDLFEDHLYVNPEYKLIQLSYPVHQLHPNQLGEHTSKGDYFVLVYRHQDSGDVEFFGISALHAYIVSQISEVLLTLPQLINNTCSVFGIENNLFAQEQITAFIKTLKEKRFILGYQF